MQGINEKIGHNAGQDGEILSGMRSEDEENRIDCGNDEYSGVHGRHGQCQSCG
jgi:hypothetical protein